MPQMPSRQSESNAIGSSPFAISPSLTTSSISRNDMSGETSLGRVVDQPPGCVGPGLPPDFQIESHVDPQLASSFELQLATT